MRKRTLVLVAFGVASLAVCYCRVIPIGASPEPFLLASVDEGHSIPGKNYAVFYNDAGAAHSGFHFTWVVADRVLFRQVVLEGYSTPGVRMGDDPLPIREVGGRTEMGFASGRRDPTLEWIAVP